MGNVSKRIKYGRYYYLEYFRVGFSTELCLFILFYRIPKKAENKKVFISTFFLSHPNHHSIWVSSFSIEKNLVWNYNCCVFWPAFGMRSTQMLVKICNIKSGILKCFLEKLVTIIDSIAPYSPFVNWTNVQEKTPVAIIAQLKATPKSTPC